MALNIPKNKAEEPVKEEVVVEAKAEAVDGVNYGEAINDLAFVAPLGNPAKPDTTPVTLEDGTKDKKVTPAIIGYRFKALKDMRVPDCGTDDNFRNDAMNFVPERIDSWVDVKAGEEINLTPFETALLLSQPQFNGACSGGEKPVVCVYHTKKPKTKDGAVAQISAASQTPRVSLRAKEGSIKDFDIIPVLTVTEVSENGKTVKKRELNPGFDKWAPLAKNPVKRAAGVKAKKEAVDPTKVANTSAIAFLSYVEKAKVK